VLAAAFVGRDARADTKADPSSDTAKADELFKTAKDELKHGLTADACAHFAESKRLVPGVGVALYLGDCYQRIGRAASAWTAFRDAETLARERKDKRADLARHRADVLEPKLNHLTIQVTGPAPAAPLDVTCDGRRVARESWGTALPVDPGEHVVIAAAGSWSRTYGASIDARTLQTTLTIDLPQPERGSARPTPGAVAEGSKTLASPPPGVAQGEATPVTGAPAPGAEDSVSTRTWLALGLGAAGVVGVGIGTVYGIMATSHRNQSNDGPCDATDYCSASGLALRQQALSEATVSTVAFIVGLAGGAGAVTAYLLWPGGSSHTGLTVAPAVVGGGTGALLRSSF
jgi:serine/threonine-protein kinase